MSEETLQAATIATSLSEALAAFRKQPTLLAFEQLQSQLRSLGAGRELAEVCAVWAHQERDPVRAADLWSESGETLLAIGAHTEAIQHLQKALELDPGNARSVDRFCEYALSRNDAAAAVEMIERELADLSKRAEAETSKGRKPDPAQTIRRAEQHREAAQLWNNKLGRIDRALWHWQQAWRLEPTKTAALDEARKLYASLGDTAMVAKLYQAELDILPKDTAPTTRAAIRLELAKIAWSSAPPETAAAQKHLEEAARLDTSSIAIRELLAEVYCAPDSKLSDGTTRAAALLADIGKAHHARGDIEQALRALRRSLAFHPAQPVASHLLDELLIDQQQFVALDEALAARISMVSDEQRLPLLRRRAELWRGPLAANAKKAVPLIDILTDICQHEPSHSQTASEVRLILRQQQRWNDLATFIESQLTQAGDSAAAVVVVPDVLELATIAREHQNDRDRAAQLLHHALTLAPEHEEALARYVDHFRERRDWRGLCDLYEFALDNAREAGASVEELERRLEEIAQLAELRMGDVARAMDAWQRIGDIAPHNPKVTEALRRLRARSKMWEELVVGLESDLAAAPDMEMRTNTLRRMAQTYRERQIEPRRAIEAYEQLATDNPNDEVTLKALAELYEREGDDAGLALTLRRQIDADEQSMNVPGVPSEPRQWPVARRTERLNQLRRIANLYDTRLSDVDGVVFSCSAILDLIPGDRDALERMERVLDKAEDPRLEQTLEYHASASQNLGERCKLYKRLATIATNRHDDVTALVSWEKALAASPSDTETLHALADLYQHNFRWTELTEVLERLDGATALPAPGTAEAAIRTAQLERYAMVVDKHIHDSSRAIKLFVRIVEISPMHRGALSALTRLYREGARWRELAQVLGRQVELFATADLGLATQMALEQATIFEHRLGSPNEAIKVLEHLIGDINHHDVKAHEALRNLHESRGNYDAAVRIAEREMYLTTEPQAKIARGLEIGITCREQLNDPLRALQAFERVLSVDPAQPNALAACAEILGRLGRHKEEVRALEKYLATIEDVRERVELTTAIGHVHANKLNDPRIAFRWYRRAHDESPQKESLTLARRAAERLELWREYADMLIDERKRLLSLGNSGTPAHPASFVSHSRELAGLNETKLGDKPRAMTAISEALSVHRRDRSLLAELERLATAVDSRSGWKILLDGYDAAITAATSVEKVELHLNKARVVEEKTNDPRLAMAELLAAFSWSPVRDDARQALYQLAPKARAWPEVVSLESALVERAASAPMRLAALRRKANVIEEQIKDAPRAFRNQLVAFLVDPTDADTVATLWRLARVIGRYREADKTPKSETAIATIQSDAAVADAQRIADQVERASAAVAVVRAGTEELQELDFDEAPAEPSVGDNTQPIDLEELEVEARRNRPTMSASGRGRMPPGAPPPMPAMAMTGSGGHLRDIGSGSVSTGKPPTMPPAKKGPAFIRRVPVPVLPNRAFESPWEEFAFTYEQLPVTTTQQKLRWLFAAAEVWETGAKDVTRCFDLLAHAFSLSRTITDDDGEAKARLHRIAAEHKLWDRLGDLYEHLAESANTPVMAAELLLEVAAIRQQQRRSRDAESTLRRVLGMVPDDSHARSRLEALYRDDNRWVELAAALEERTDPRLGHAATLAERPTMLLELAAVYTNKLQRPHDAIETLERLRSIDPNHVVTLQQLAKLYSSIVRWSKAVDCLTKLVDGNDTSAIARQAQANIAHIYEAEMGLPDRAIEAYNDLVAVWPDDTDSWQALDRLYTQHARWTDLTDVLRRRAAQATDTKQQIELLARRAQILLDWVKAPEDAVAALRHAKSVADDEVTQDWLSDQLIVALSHAGRDREAATMLENRIVNQSTLPAGDMAALQLRLAELRHGKLRDPIGARAAVQAALALVPQHPSALAMFATLAATGDDPLGFAHAKLRSADAAVDDDARVDALMEAGEAFRDRNVDPTAARGCFERVLAMRPYHADATWALAGLVEQSGEPEAAARLLSNRLEDATMAAGEKARIHTQLAALSRMAGVEPAAERHLLEALTHDPGHVAAIVALADFYAERDRHQDLTDFLRDVIADQALAGERSAPPTAFVAELHRRLAAAYEKLGRDEDAYQTLMAADRLARGHLLIKLALGENRYKARRWREAALHLAPLASHDEAPKYAQEVAQGLYHAALAEIRSLRPERAAALYSRALELRPNFGPALQAMAEIAMEQGDAKKASELLTRQAQATDDAAERLRLYEALGDMALLMLRDESRARDAYSAAVASANPLEARHLPLLEKLLERQDYAADFAGSARTAELMSAFGANHAARSVRLLRAAKDYVSAGDIASARAVADRATNADPGDLEAVDIASNLAMTDGDSEHAATILGRSLAGKGDNEPVLRAALWQRLGQARQARGDHKQAHAAYERALAVAPTSLGALAARRGLVELWRLAATTGTPPAVGLGTDTVTEHLRTVVHHSGEVADLLPYAHDIASGSSPHAAAVLYEVIASCGMPVIDQQLPAAMAADASYRSVLSPSARAMISDWDIGALAPVISSITEAAALLWPDNEDALTRLGLNGAVRATSSSNSAALSMFPKIAAALATGAAILYQREEVTNDAQVVCAATPIIVLSERLMKGHFSLADTRALITRAVEMTRPEHIAIIGLAPLDAARTLAAVVRLFGPPGLRDAANALIDDQDVQRGIDETVRGALSVKLRTKLEQLLKVMDPSALDLTRYTAAIHRTADRAALLLGGSASAIAASNAYLGQTAALISLVGHPHWHAARTELGV